MSDKKYAVTLSSCGNIDHGQNPFEPLFGVPNKKEYADTIEELQEIVRDYISENALGGGNWTGGDVYEVKTGVKVGYISYNGRYWEEKENE